MIDLIDLDEVHDWLHQIRLHYRGALDQAEAEAQHTAVNGPVDRLFAGLRTIDYLHTQRHPECRVGALSGGSVDEEAPA